MLLGDAAARVEEPFEVAPNRPDGAFHTAARGGGDVLGEPRARAHRPAAPQRRVPLERRRRAGLFT